MADLVDPIGITTQPVAGQDSVPVYQSDKGVPTFPADAPYLLSDGKSLESPMPVIDAGGPVWIDAGGNAVDALAVTTVPSGNTLIPGPLDLIIGTIGNASVGGMFDLATGNMTLAISTRYAGEFGGFTATHGGEALTLVREDHIDGVATGVFIGNNLTTESAQLVVSLSGATLGPSVLRMRDDWGIGEIETDWNDGRAVHATNTGQLRPAGLPEPRKVLFAAASQNVTGATNIYANGGAEVQTGLRGIVLAGDYERYLTIVQIERGWTHNEDGTFTRVPGGGSPLSLGFGNFEGAAIIRIVYSSETSLFARLRRGGTQMVTPALPAGESLTAYLFAPAHPDDAFLSILFVHSSNATIFSVESVRDPVSLMAIIGSSVGDMDNGMGIHAGTSPLNNQAISAFTIYGGA